MDCLSHIIADQIDARYWKLCKACEPKVSHLLFTDDLLLFAKATIEQAYYITHCPDQFCQVSDQKINVEKIQIFFIANVDPQLRQ